jgi:hypothetical protein
MDSQPTLFPKGHSSTVKKSSSSINTTIDLDVKTFTKNTGITGATLLTFCWGLVLAIYENSNDVFVGLLSSGREESLFELTNVIGVCIIAFFLFFVTNFTVKNIALY